MKLRALFILFIWPILPVSSQTQGNWFFNYNQIHEIHINFYLPNFYDSLVAYKAEDNQSGIENYIAATVIVDSIQLDSVGIRFRGNSSYNHPGTKKPIQLDFNEFISGQKLNGLKKLNLNNSFLDPTQIREKLFLDILNHWNVSAPRCTFAKVYFNGAYIGLYKALETINSDFIEKKFGNNDGNLYKCEPDMPLSWEGWNQNAYYDNCELKNNLQANDWSNLVTFIHYTANQSILNFESQIRNYFNIDEYLRAYAANVVFGNLDSYVYLAHNYYLYHNTSTNQFEWITWDVSLAFGVYAMLIVPNSVDFKIDYLPNNARTSRPLHFFIQNTLLREQYNSQVCYLIKNYFRPGYLFQKIDSIASVIRPAVYAEPLANQMFTVSQFEGNLGYSQVNYQLIGQIPGLKDYILKRRKNISTQLCNKNWNCNTNSLFSGGDDFLKVYPNPADDYLVLEFAAIEPGTPIEIDLYDFSGRLIHNWVLYLDPSHNRFEVDLLNFASGTYIIKMKSFCEEVHKKIVVR